DAGYVSVALSMRPSQKDRPRLAPGTLLCAVWTFLSDPPQTDQSGRPSSRQPEYTTLGHTVRANRPAGGHSALKMSGSLTFGARKNRIRGIPTGGDPGQSNDRPHYEHARARRARPAHHRPTPGRWPQADD